MDLFERVGKICAQREAVVGLFRRNDTAARFVPISDVFAVWFEGSDNLPKVSCYPLADMGPSVLIGGRAGRTPDGRYILKTREEEVYPAGTTKLARFGETSDKFRQGYESDVRTLRALEYLVHNFETFAKEQAAIPPTVYVSPHNPAVPRGRQIEQAYPGRNIDQHIVALSQFRNIRGVPLSPMDGAVRHIDEDGTITLGDDRHKAVVKPDAKELQLRLLPVFGPVAVPLYPSVGIGQRVLKDQPLYQLFPRTVRCAEEIQMLPEAKILRWLTLQDLVVSSDGLPLVPLSAVSEGSSYGAKFVDFQTSPAALRVITRYSADFDPLRVSDGSLDPRDNPGVVMDLRFTWHHDYLSKAYATPKAK